MTSLPRRFVAVACFSPAPSIFDGIRYDPRSQGGLELLVILSEGDGGKHDVPIRAHNEMEISAGRAVASGNRLNKSGIMGLDLSQSVQLQRVHRRRPGEEVRPELWFVRTAALKR